MLLATKKTLTKVQFADLSSPLKAAAMYTRTKMVKPNEVAMVSTLAASRLFAAGFAATQRSCWNVSAQGLDKPVLPYDCQSDKQLKLFRMMQSELF